MTEEIRKKLCTLSGLSDIEAIPEGGQSYAFSAFDQTLQRKVFLKAYWYSEKYKDSLLLEPRKLTSLYQSSENTKQHIVILYSADIIEVGDEKYIVLRMEYCDGLSLSKKIPDHGLSISDAINIGKYLCEGLHYLHSVNIAHRDIKPSNIMVNENRGKLIDLGSAIQLENDGWTPVQSHKTPLYSPPEVLGSDKQYHLKSDIYQVGAVLFEMIFGTFDLSRIPRKYVIKALKSLGIKSTDLDDFQKSQVENKTIRLLAEKNDLFNKVSNHCIHIPKSLIKVLKRATLFDADMRYSSCVELRAELTKLNIPNWIKVSNDEYFIENWNGRDYKIYTRSTKRGSEFIFESSKTGVNLFRRNKSITTIQEAIKNING